MILAAVATVMQAADLLSSFALAPGEELNPIRAAADPLQAVVLKVAELAVIVAAAAVLTRWRFPGLAQFVLLAGVVAGSLGTGSNLVALG